MSSISILNCHKMELESLLRDKQHGVTQVRHIRKYVKDSDGLDETKMITIDEAIESWQTTINAMLAGADQEDYNY